VSAASFKEKLRAGEAVRVINPDYPSGALVEFLGRPGLGVDAVMIDTEQGSADVESVEDMARAARLNGLCSLVRVFSPEPWVIERLMFRGVDGIVVPRIDAAAGARAVVEAVRYCFPRDADAKVIVLQIESVAAHRALDELLAIDGIDAYFVGPVDLAKSMGCRGDTAAPEVQRAIEDILARTRKAGRAAGPMVKPADERSWQAAGAQLLYFHVNDWLALGAKTFPADPATSRIIPP
jgi:2-keto-3-deoxy-L-rhamnonate aldolase RhmA